MSLFSGPGLIISVPGAELEKIGWRGSLAEPHEILGATLSPELRLAVQVIRDAAVQRGMRIVCVARPELFSAGVSATWLRTHAPGFSQHLFLSDGTAVKYLPGFANHVFFYGLTRPDQVAALRKLTKRVPDILNGLGVQVNTRIKLAGGGGEVRPTCNLVWATSPQPGQRAPYWPFFLNAFSAEDTANRIAQAGPVEKNRTIGFEMAQYFALTATAMADPAFARFVAHRIQTACFDRATLLILRLPVIPNGENPLLAGIAAILPALRQTGVIIPRTIVPNILFATEDLEEDQHMSALPPLHMMVHESFDFWRYTQSFYTEAASISVLVSNPGTGGDEHSMDVRPIYGPNARLHWLPPESGVGSLRLFA